MTCKKIKQTNKIKLQSTLRYQDVMSTLFWPW